MQPLNLSGKDFCRTIGIAYNNDILRELRALSLVRYFKVGKKYMYPYEDALKVSERLLNGEISIKTDSGYYITVNQMEKM